VYVLIATWRNREVIRSKAARRPRAASGATIFIDRTARGSS